MASTHNAFELLLASEHSTKPGSKKKRNKKKQPVLVEPNNSAVQEVAHSVEVNDDHDFKPVPQHQVIKARAAPYASKSSMDKQQHSLVSASSAGAAFEKEIRNLSATGRITVVDKWTAQVLQAEKGPMYSSGSQQLNFKQVLLKSAALEQLVDGCLEDCKSTAEAAHLTKLFEAIAHPTSPAGLAHALNSVIQALSQLAAADPLFDSTQSRQVVARALHLLKIGLSSNAVGHEAERLGELCLKLEKLEALLPKVSSLKEQARLWSDAYSIMQQQIDAVCCAKSAPGTREVASVLGPLLSLQKALEGRLKEMQIASSGASMEKQLKHADACFSDNKAAIQARLAEVEGRMKTLELELENYRKEAVQLTDRHSRAHEHHQQLVITIKNGAAASASVETEMQAGLGALNQLRITLETASTAGLNGMPELAAQLAAKEVPGKFINAAQQVMDVQIKTLQELSGRAQFYRDRLAQAVRQGEHLSLLKLVDEKQKQEQQKQVENLNKMLQELFVSAHTAVKVCQDAAQACQLRLGPMQSLPGFAQPSRDLVARMDALALQASQLLKQFMAEPAQQPAARKAKPTPAAQGVNGISSAGQAGDASLGGGLTVPITVSSTQSEVAALEQRLAELEKQSKHKDEQIAALLSKSTMEVPSPLPAMLSPPPASAVLAAPCASTEVPPQAPLFIGSHGPSEPASLFSHSRPSRSVPLAGTEQAVGGQDHGGEVPLLLNTSTSPEPGVTVTVNTTNAPKIVSSFAEALSAGRSRAPRA